MITKTHYFPTLKGRSPIFKHLFNSYKLITEYDWNADQSWNWIIYTWSPTVINADISSRENRITLWNSSSITSWNLGSTVDNNITYAVWLPNSYNLSFWINKSWYWINITENSWKYRFSIETNNWTKYVENTMFTSSTVNLWMFVVRDLFWLGWQLDIYINWILNNTNSWSDTILTYPTDMTFNISTLTSSYMYKPMIWNKSFDDNFALRFFQEYQFLVPYIYNTTGLNATHDYWWFARAWVKITATRSCNLINTIIVPTSFTSSNMYIMDDTNSTQLATASITWWVANFNFPLVNWTSYWILTEWNIGWWWFHINHIHDWWTWYILNINSIDLNYIDYISPSNWWWIWIVPLIDFKTQ